MKTVFIMILMILFHKSLICQSKIEDDIEYAFQNAKKGIYWALVHIPEKKNKIENNLIADDKLYSSVKLLKAVDGIKIESTGYYNTNEVTIKIFRSNESLETDGYLKNKETNEVEKRKE